MGGGGGVQQPKQITLGQTVGDIMGSQPRTFETEAKFQPQYQQLGQQLSQQSLQNFGQAMQGTINPNAAALTGQQYANETGLYNQYSGNAGASILGANPWIGQAETASEGIYNQGLANQQTANNLFNSGQGGVAAGENVIQNSLDMGNVMGSSPMLLGLNAIAGQQLSNFGGVTPQEMNAIDQGTGATFAANGLFNSNPAAAAALLNRDQFAQARLQQWTDIGQGIQGLNTAQQQSLFGAGQALGGIGTQQQSTGTQLANFAGMQQEFGIGGIQNASSMLQGGIQGLISPDQYNANLQSLASSFSPGQVTPQIVPQELGTASGLNEFNAQGQFAANAANAQLANQQNAAMMGLGGAGIAALGSIIGGMAAGGVFCHVAREVYGIENIRWVMFRNWLISCAPVWFVRIYKKFGKSFAEFIHDKPFIKNCIRKLMDKVIREDYELGQAAI